MIRQLRQEYLPEKIVMVGDGVSDLETVPVVDIFVGFGRYLTRPKVKAEARYFVQALEQLLEIL